MVTFALSILRFPSSTPTPGVDASAKPSPPLLLVSAPSHARTDRRTHDRAGILVLRVLDQEHHEEGEDRGARVDHELPGIRVVKSGAGHGPGENDRHRHPERPCRARDRGGALGEMIEPSLESTVGRLPANMLDMVELHHQ